MASAIMERQSSSAEISQTFRNAAKDIDLLHDSPSNEIRKSAAAIAQKLVAAFEEPDDVVMRYAWEVENVNNCNV